MFKKNVQPALTGHHPKQKNAKLILAPSGGGLSQDFAGSGQNRVTAKNRVRTGPSHSPAHNITVAKFN